jgi:hypothetical protein
VVGEGNCMDLIFSEIPGGIQQLRQKNILKKQTK